MPKTAFFISPVRGIVDGSNPVLTEKLRQYVASLEAKGYKVHWPLRDTNQNDHTGGWNICRTNFKAIIEADEIHYWYDEDSKGSLFDFGGVFMLCEMCRMTKKIVPANENEVSDEVKKRQKDFFHVLKRLAERSS